MPVRSLSLSVLKWPTWRQVDQAVRLWAMKMAKSHKELCRLGYFGSYARGDWGVGSDIDLMAVVEKSGEPIYSRALSWNLLDLPVQAELIVYTKEEWRRLIDKGGRFADTLKKEVVWVYSQTSML